MYRETREYMVIKGSKVYLPHIYISNVNEEIEITFCSEDSEVSGKQVKAQVLLTLEEASEFLTMLESVIFRASKEEVSSIKNG